VVDTEEEVLQVRLTNLAKHVAHPCTAVSAAFLSAASVHHTITAGR